MSDSIDRQAAIDALDEEPYVWNDTPEELGVWNMWHRHKDALMSLPSAQPEITLLQATKTVLEFMELCGGTTAFLITPDGEKLSCDWGYVEEGLRELVRYAERRTDEPKK